MKKIYFFTVIGILGLLSSCSTDGDSDGSANRISYYVTEAKSTYDGESQPYSHSKTTYVLNDGKMFTETYKDMLSDYEYTAQPYHYTDGLLTSIERDFESTAFHYDSERKLISLESGGDVGETSYMRFVYVSSTIAYTERLSAPATDPDAEITSRIILEFDAEDNVVAAGFDVDLDGVMDHVNNFTYQNNDLIGMTHWTGGTLVNTYSDVINNHSVINDATYGKKEARLVSAIFYADPNYFPPALHSYHLLDVEFSDGDFEVLPSRYFKKVNYNGLFPGGSYQSETEFFFNY